MRVTNIALVLVAVIGCGATACNQDRAIATEAMNKGLQELSGGSQQEALELLKQAANADSTYADPPYYVGLTYHERYNEHERAQDFYKRALERDPQNAQFLYKLGTVQAMQGKHDDAVASFTKATKTVPRFAKAWFRLGLALRADKKYLKAAEAYGASIEVDPTMKVTEDDQGGAAFHELGDLYLRFRLYDRAEQVYDEGIKFNPAVARLHRGKGLAQVKQKKHPEAIATFTKALELEPGNESAYFNLAVAQEAAGQVEAAIATLTKYESMATDFGRQVAANAMRTKLEGSRQAREEPEK
ncbi:MAG: tetratricopeptide repeat protein [Myxococcota bacterium]